MKSSLFATGLVGLAFAALWFLGDGIQPLPTASADDSPRVAAPLAHENLSVYFVHGADTVSNAKVMNLQEALEREVAVVHETSDVNTLAVENRSEEYELFVQSGDIVKGGKQDRMAATDMLLPPKSGVVPLPAHCVEQGRWTNRGAEDARRFKSSEKCVVGKDMKIANFNGQQPAVWQKVAENQGKLRANVAGAVTADASPTSFQLTLESPAVLAKVTEYEAALKSAGENRTDIIGVVFVVNGHVTGAEVYGSNALFRKAWPKLLNAAAVEAVAERTDQPTAAAPSAREIERFLAYGANPEPAGADDLPFIPPYDRDHSRCYPGESLNRVDNVALDRMQRASRRSGPVEVFQTEGRTPELQQTEGRGPRQGDQQAGQPIAGAQPLFDPVGQPNGQQPRPVAGYGNFANRPMQSAPNPPGQPLGQVTDGTTNAIANGGAGVASLQPPPANAAGNRLNSNRTENRSTLMVESRDPARANAVIHRSYVKK